MKNDKFLIGIIAGIVLLVVVAIIMVLTRGQGEDYIADDAPAGVVHNYFLALQRKDYERAYSYLADDLQSKPDLDKFIRDMDSQRYGSSEASLQIGETRLDDDRSQVDVLALAPHIPVPIQSLRTVNRPASLLASAMTACMRQAVAETMASAPQSPAP